MSMCAVTAPTLVNQYHTCVGQSGTKIYDLEGIAISNNGFKIIRNIIRGIQMLFPSTRIRMRIILCQMTSIEYEYGYSQILYSNTNTEYELYTVAIYNELFCSLRSS